MDGFWDIIIPEDDFQTLQTAFSDMASLTLKRESKDKLTEFFFIEGDFIQENNLEVIKHEVLDVKTTVFENVTAELIKEELENYEETMLEKNGTRKYDKTLDNLKCVLCSNMLPNKYQLRLHHRMTHSQLPVIKCEELGCEKAIFKSEKMLHKHLEKKHNHLCSE